MDDHVVPLLVSTLPEVPGATNATAEVPLPRSTLFAAKVAAPVPPLPTGSVPVTPVVKGRPVQLVSVPLVGVPKTGVTKVGLVLKTTLPLPVLVVVPVPPLVTGKAVPDKPIAIVPDEVIGTPLTERKAGTVALTEVTVPLVAGVVDCQVVPLLVSTLPEVPGATT